MNKKTIVALMAGFTAICSFSACEDIIDVKLNSVDPELVIEGTIRMGAAAEVWITKTKDFDATNEYPPIKDAVVVISDDAGNVETLACNAQGRYVATTIVGMERTTYHLSVTYEEVEYTATSYMPPKVKIDSLTVWKAPIMEYAFPRVHFVDPVGKENEYYRCILYINGEKPLLNDRLEDQLISTEFVDGTQITQPVFVRYVNSGRDDKPIQQGYRVTVEMQCIDKAVYTYFDTLYHIDEGLANPTTNIKGGALGYFGAYSFTSASVMMEWED